MKLVRIIAPHFTAGFETDGIVRRCAPIIAKTLKGKTDDEVRQIVTERGWKARVVRELDPDDLEWPNGHEFITVLRRRWCLGCGLYQAMGASAFPRPKMECDRSSPRAIAADLEISLLLQLQDPASQEPS